MENDSDVKIAKPEEIFFVPTDPMDMLQCDSCQ